MQIGAIIAYAEGNPVQGTRRDHGEGPQDARRGRPDMAAQQPGARQSIGSGGPPPAGTPSGPFQHPPGIVHPQSSSSAVPPQPHTPSPYPMPYPAHPAPQSATHYVGQAGLTRQDVAQARAHHAPTQPTAYNMSPQVPSASAQPHRQSVLIQGANMNVSHYYVNPNTVFSCKHQQDADGADPVCHDAPSHPRLLASARRSTSRPPAHRRSSSRRPLLRPPTPF